MTIATTAIATLYWNARGEIACDDHAPQGTSSWTYDDWQAIPTDVAAAEGLSCELCR